jgi:hypothetical protein
LDFSHAYLLLTEICRTEIYKLRWYNELEGALCTIDRPNILELLSVNLGLLGHTVEKIASIITTTITLVSKHVPLAAYLNLEAGWFIIHSLAKSASALENFFPLSCQGALGQA